MTSLTVLTKIGKKANTIIEIIPSIKKPNSNKKTVNNEFKK